MYVHVAYTPEDAYQTRLVSQLDDEIHVTFGETLPASPQYEILVAGRPMREQLTASPRLHTLIIPFAGLPDTTRHLLAGFPDLQVHNLHHNAAPTAEMGIALMLATARMLLPADRIFRSHDWTPRHAPMPARLLHGKTMLILGYGAIGQRIAAVCKALGMTVLATKRRLETDKGYPDAVYPPKQLDDLLPRADVLMICLPLTDETQGLIDRAALARLPAKAIVINIGRAAVVQEQALYEALRDGKLHAAGMDVWYNYPANVEARTHTPPAIFPFHELDNVVMSPHRAGGVGTPENEFARMDALAVSLNAALRGGPIPNPVDVVAGY